VERSVSKPALITPSASPPSSRSFFPQPYRIPDKALPAKRPRLASTSSHLQSHLPSSSSSSASLDQIDVHQAREASTLRLFDVWSTLADRYSRPIDEDDIIDITTGEVVKDRGVLRGSRNWNIGCFADNVEEDEEEEEDEDEEVDELDAFANPGEDEEPGGVPLDVDEKRVPPVTEVDPADAEDLKQFLEAERRRREICGSEEETESSGEENLDEDGVVDERLRNHARSEVSAPSLERSATQVEEGDGVGVGTGQTPRREPSVFVDSGSDDELVNWDLDEASMIYRLPKKENDRIDSDSDIEFIDAPALRPPSSSPLRPKSKPNPQASKKKARQSSKPAPSENSTPGQTQLQTPQFHFNCSTTPSEDYIVPLPPEHSSALRSSSPASCSHDESSPTKPRQAKSRPRKPESKSQRPVVPQISQDILAPPIPRLDLAKIARGRGVSKSTRTTPRPRITRQASELAIKSSNHKHRGVEASTVSMETRKRKRVASSEFEAADLDSAQKSPVAESKTLAHSENSPVLRARTDSFGSESPKSAFPERMFVFWYMNALLTDKHQNLRQDLNREENRGLSHGPSRG